MRSNKPSKSFAAFSKSVKAHAVKWQTVKSGLVWKPETEGESIIGVIAGRTVIDTKFGLAPQIEIRNPETDETYLLLSSKAGLRVLNRVPLETPCRVTYEGTKPIPKRKQVMDVFNVEIPVNTKLEAQDWAAQYYKQRKGGKAKGKAVKTAKRSRR